MDNWIPTDATLQRINQTVVAHVDGSSLDRFQKRIQELCEDAEINRLFGGGDRAKFKGRTVFLYRHAFMAAYTRKRRAQIATAGFEVLVYRSRDCRSAAHQELDGLALPAGDQFWSNYLPPNIWDCDCAVAGAHLWSSSSVLRLGGDPEKKLPAWYQEDMPERGLDEGFECNRIPSIRSTILAISRGVADEAAGF